MAKHVICIVNQKGGVGKTNVAANLIAELAARGRSVTAIDLDPQATLSRFMVGRDERPGTAEVIEGEATIASVAIPSVPAFGAKIVVSIPDEMRSAIKRQQFETGSERTLGKALAAYDEDIVIMDCPPEFGWMIASALIAANSGVIIPVAVADEAVDGFAQIMVNLQRLREVFDRPFPLLGVVPTMFDARTRKHKEIMAALQQHVNVLLWPPIRKNVRLEELFALQTSARDHAPKSTGAADYAAVAGKVLDAIR